MAEALEDNSEKESIMVFYERFLSDIFKAKNQNEIFKINEKYS